MRKSFKIALLLLITAVFLSACGGKKDDRPVLPTATLAHSHTEATAAPESTAPVTTVPVTTVPETTDPPDAVPPVIEGVTDKTVYQGETIAYRTGVTVTDDTDPAPQLEILQDGVDLNVPGEYTVTYLARDASGNETQATATVTVLELKDGYLSIEEVNKKVDDILARIVRSDMTVEEQCKAIYNWMRNGRFGYNGKAVKKDVYQSAYELLKMGTGDCYCYYALSKLMFERLGIPNIDVEKVPQYNGDSHHYWSMVSTDNGETWYHFDVTPRLGNAPYFCLVTDEFLDKYSDSHGGTHHRDKSLYPATP